MIEGLVTVVLPIYNVKKYLDRCVNSVVNQTYSNIEILLIDDGSTDGCYELCEEWALRDSRIRVIHKENQGLGMARNTGIENANGEYICFFDSDDFVAPNTVEDAYSEAVKNNSDIVLFGINFADENGNVVGNFVTPLGNVRYSENEVQSFFLPEFIAPDPNGRGKKLFYMSPCLMLYSLNVIKKSKWRFVSERNIISEDVYSLLNLFENVKSVSVIPKAFYFYCKNESSLSSKYREDRFDKLNNFYSEAKKLCTKKGYDEEIIHRVSKPYLSFVIAAMKQEIVFSNSTKKRKNKVRKMVDDETLQEVLQANKKDKVSITRRILFFAIRNKMYNLCYLLLKLKA